MKREGRQHGMVQTYPIVQAPWNPRRTSKFTSPATAAAGAFSKVSRKPTNHSKFTGRCGRARCSCCHSLPTGKSKDKAKGTQRFRSADVVSNYRLVTWRVADPRPGLKLTGFSASEILDHLANDYSYDHDEDVDDDVDEYGYGYGPYEYGFRVDPDEPVVSTGIEVEELDADDVNGSEGDVMMSFCDVGFVWEQVDVEVDGDVDGWCLVDEI